ncbi:MAG: PQQ-binding-like beta-propeller repeat protein [Labilithrix sp.]|nr:PQQ-binding-like beta-propeller repeat protein [Labilithrix sp.]MCW5812636.1 PQQ-binding-like beta-propeller repeat protein [Labilithrix sp.]
MRHLTPLVVLVLAASCSPAGQGASPLVPAAASSTSSDVRLRSGETSTFVPTGPQSFTPEARFKMRDRAVRQLWSSSIGRTDHRTTMLVRDGAVWIGTKRGPSGPAGVHVIDGRSGARRALLPAAAGDVVGIAMEGDRVYSSSAGPSGAGSGSGSASGSGEVAATTKGGAIVFRTAIGAAVMTPPTLVDADGDGTLEVAVGDATGKVTLLDGRTGKVRWSRVLGSATDGRREIGGGLAAADLDHDGKPEIVAGTDGGRLYALRAATGETAWQTSRASSLRAPPLVADVDADGHLEVVAGWADGDIAIFDGRNGKELWSALMEEDDGDSTGLLATPTPIPGGSMLVPTSRWGKEDAVVVLRANERAYRSRQGSVVASPVLGTLAQGATMTEAVVGTMQGDVVAFDAAGGISFLYRLDAPIEAPALIADIERNGLQELVVATRDGRLVALATHAPLPPLAGVARGASGHNDGVFPAIDLGWRLP